MRCCREGTRTSGGLGAERSSEPPWRCSRSRCTKSTHHRRAKRRRHPWHAQSSTGHRHRSCSARVRLQDRLPVLVPSLLVALNLEPPPLHLPSSENE